MISQTMATVMSQLNQILPLAPPTDNDNDATSGVIADRVEPKGNLPIRNCREFRYKYITVRGYLTVIYAKRRRRMATALLKLFTKVNITGINVVP